MLYIYDMTKSFLLIGFLFGGCSLFTDEPAKSSLPDTPKKIELPAISSSIIPEANAFGIDLFTRTAAEDQLACRHPEGRSCRLQTPRWARAGKMNRVVRMALSQSVDLAIVRIMERTGT